MLPHVILYNAVSLDGRITGFNADEELYYELASKWDIDAVLMGINTVLMGFKAEFGDKFEEDLDFIIKRERNPEDPRPFLVIPDSKGRIRIWSELFKMPYLRDIIVLCSESTPKEYLNFLDERNIDYIITGKEQVDLKAALEKLNTQYGIKSLRVDSGGILNGILLREGLADEIHLLVHPELVGGFKSNSIFQESNISSLEGIIKVKLSHIDKLKNDIIWIKYEIIR
ncbi:dihydrofolate reductase family protein [Methanobacterium oryzae]|uniref:dihydrofolate reductase family protein n=1 Tax=Methanobacterium oryzae TaxID=69540 RepID=UPI003D1C3E92